MAAQCVASQAVTPRASAAAPCRGNHAHQNKCVKAAEMRRAQHAVSRRVGGRGVIMAASQSTPFEPEVVRNPRPEYIPSRIDDPEYVRVFDTTLRDGEQSPGASSAHALRRGRIHVKAPKNRRERKKPPPPAPDNALNLKCREGGCARGPNHLRVLTLEDARQRISRCLQ